MRPAGSACLSKTARRVYENTGAVPVYHLWICRSGLFNEAQAPNSEHHIPKVVIFLAQREIVKGSYEILQHRYFFQECGSFSRNGKVLSKDVSHWFGHSSRSPGVSA